MAVNHEVAGSIPAGDVLIYLYIWLYRGMFMPEEIAEVESFENTEQPEEKAAPQSNGKAIGSLICGIISVLFGLPLLGLILGIVAIVLGIKAKKQSPSGVATAGIVLGIIGTLIGVVLLVLMLFAVMAYFGALAPDRYLPDKCVMNPPFSCTEYKATDGSLQIGIQNNAGKTITVDSIIMTCGTEEYPSDFTGEMVNGGSTSITWDHSCENSAERFSGRFMITYTTEDSISHTSSGSVQAMVE